MVVLKNLLGRRTFRVLELVFTHLVFAAVVVPFIFVFFYMFLSSVKPDYLFFEPDTWIFTPVLWNYEDVLSQSSILPNILNSFIISTSATLIGIACGLMTGYTIARFGLRRLAVAILITRMIPYITALVPFFILYRFLGLLNTHVGLILSHLVITVPLAVWILIGYIEDIPRDLEEAAWIDGATKVQTFFQVVIPLTIPGIVATAILCFIFSWNNFQLALVLGGFDVNTAPVSVYKYADPESGSMGQMMAAATLVTIPVFFIVMFIQKQMAAGLTVGGISK